MRSIRRGSPIMGDELLDAFRRSLGERNLSAVSAPRVQLQLNRGEHRHILAKWLFFANRGEFRDGDINEIMNKTSCLSLLSNAVVIWDTIHMQKIVSRLQDSGETVKQEDLALNWPLLHAHIIPNGMYDFSGC